MVKWYSITLCDFLSFLQVTNNTRASHRENTLFCFPKNMIEAMKFTGTKKGYTSSMITGKTK
jgi:hypothetical protein